MDDGNVHETIDSASCPPHHQLCFGSLDGVGVASAG